MQENALYTELILTNLKYTVDCQGSTRPDHQGEDNTQTHNGQRLWQLTEYNKLQTASGFELTLQATLHMETIIVSHYNARRQIPSNRKQKDK